MDCSYQLRIPAAVFLRSCVAPAVRADLSKASCLIAGRTNGTGVHALSLAEPLHLFHVFATYTLVFDSLKFAARRGGRHDDMKPESSGPPNRQHLEIEVKLKIRNLRTLRKSLLELGCQEHVPRTLEQNWAWDFPGQPLRQQGQLLRVRQFAGQCVLTFKGSARQSRHFKIREELETGIQDQTVLCRILEHLGLAVTFRYEKFRTSYSLKLSGQKHSVKLTVDETPIGNYLEIEGAERYIYRIAVRLGFTPKDFIKESYLALFAKSRLRKSRQDMVFLERS